MHDLQTIKKRNDERYANLRKEDAMKKREQAIARKAARKMKQKAREQ